MQYDFNYFIYEAYVKEIYNENENRESNSEVIKHKDNNQNILNEFKRTKNKFFSILKKINVKLKK